jgi:hypothetical protein
MQGHTDNEGDGGAGATGRGELHPTVERASERASERDGGRDGGEGEREREREGGMEGRREGGKEGRRDGGTGLQNVQPHYALGNSLWAAPCQPRPIP